MKILIVEDDPLALELLQKTLEAMGHEVDSVGDGVRAWERLQVDQFPLVITDWLMPGVDGLELCRRVRQCRDNRLPYTYVILLTGRSGREDRTVAYEAGADDFLTKPLDGDELGARIGVARRILDMHDDLRCRSLQLERVNAELQRQHDRLAEVAVCDGLTGLKNRRYFREVLDVSFSFAGRKNLPLSVVMLDVDHFKDFNDTFGHPAGDVALVDLAILLRENAREHDLPARYGGEEFVILLAATDAREALAFCERLRAQVEARGWPLRAITASFGVATSSPRTASGTQLVDEADRALYVSKQRGRNRVTHYEDSLQAAL